MEFHASAELHLAFKNFKDRNVEKPEESLTIAKRICRDFMQEVEDKYSQHAIFHRSDHIASLCDGVKFRNSRENDEILVVIDEHKKELMVLDDQPNPGYAWLKLNREEPRRPVLAKVLQYWNIFGSIFDCDLYVNPDRTIDILLVELQKVINESSKIMGKLKLLRHGPSIHLEIYPDSGILLWGPCLLSLDLVPAYQVGGALYVSKPSSGDIPSGMTWRRSFSMQEKPNLPDAAKCVLRALMIGRDREAELKPLTLYHMKTVLFYELDDEEDWNDHALVFRFLGVLRRLEISLSYENLPHYFLREINLFSSMPAPCLRDIRERIKRIRTSDHELLEILRS